MIYDGPQKPSKLRPQTKVEEKIVDEHFVDKSKVEWTIDDKDNVLKDAKVKKKKSL